MGKDDQPVIIETAVKNIGRSDLPVLFVSSFNCHDLVDTDCVTFNRVKKGKLRGYVYSPLGKTSFGFHNIPRRLEMCGQPVDMFSDNVPLFIRQRPDIILYVFFDFYLHEMLPVKDQVPSWLLPRECTDRSF